MPAVHRRWQVLTGWRCRQMSKITLTGLCNRLASGGTEDNQLDRRIVRYGDVPVDSRFSEAIELFSACVSQS